MVKNIFNMRFIVLITIIVGNLFLADTTLAATTKCPLSFNSAYKYSGNNAVFYITKNCTKQAFSSPTIFFSYFKSWNQVKKTTKKILDKIPKDKIFLVTIKKVVVGSKNPAPPVQAPAPTMLDLPQSKTVWDLYQIKPTQSEIDTITKDFNLFWQDAPGLTWPNDFKFDQKSTDPSKMVIISKFNALRHQEFSEPLPFTNGKSIYEYVKTYLSAVPLSLSCAGGLIWSVWDGRSSGDCLPSAHPTPYPYVHQLQVFVHEARHSEPGDPDHSSCGLSNRLDHDQYFENGSGYSAATIYLMWVYKYSINESPIIKEAAKNDAIDFLKNRFCTKPTHSNPKVQAIIDELLK